MVAEGVGRGNGCKVHFGSCARLEVIGGNVRRDERCRVDRVRLRWKGRHNERGAGGDGCRAEMSLVGDHLQLENCFWSG